MASSPKITKTVSFAEDVKEPPLTSKCKCCGHRNISPYIRDIKPCLICQKPYCSQCVSNLKRGLICILCDIGMAHEITDEIEDEYDSGNSDHEIYSEDDTDYDSDDHFQSEFSDKLIRWLFAKDRK